MKQNKEYLETSIWYKEKMTDPYQVIAEFFSAANVSDYRKDIKKIVQSAYSCHIWKKSAPGDLLYIFGMLESIINAAYLINSKGKKSPLNIDRKDIFNPNLYCGWHSDYTEWDYFPRVLSFKEFVNPYLTFKRFFKYRKLSAWKKELHNLLEHALSSASIFESIEFSDCLSIYRYLVKLVEAVHLIDVREINHIGGNIKNRTSKRTY